jgi:uncharacterized membrane protein
MSPLLLIHVCSAVVGLLSGYVSMLFRKGSNLHRAAGMIFVVSMLIMSSTAVYVAATERPNRLNVTVGLLTFYLVTTAWRAGKRRESKTDTFDVVALSYIACVTVAGYSFGLRAVASPGGKLDHVPAFIYFLFATFALLSTISDIRMFRRGGLFGTYRIARHLWRMCAALLIATFSFFPGQARQLPDAVRHSILPAVPHIFLIVSMIYWRVRYRARKKAQRTADVDLSAGGAVARNQAA